MAGQVSSLQHFQRMGAALTATALLLFAPSVAQAAPFVGLYQSTTTGQMSIATYNTQADWLSGSASSNQNFNYSVDEGYRITGMTFDGSSYYLSMEAHNPFASNQFKFARFDSLADMAAGNVAVDDFATMGLHPYYSTSGFVYDGTNFHLLIESDTISRVTGRKELWVRSFASFDDLMNNNIMSYQSIDWRFHQSFSVASFAYEDGEYHVSIQNAARQKLHRFSFSSLTDLANAKLLENGALHTGMNSEYELIALADPPLDQLQEVPEPQTALMIIASLFGLGYWAQRRRRVAVARRGPAA